MVSRPSARSSSHRLISNPWSGRHEIARITSTSSVPRTTWSIGFFTIGPLFDDVAGQDRLPRRVLALYIDRRSRGADDMPCSGNTHPVDALTALIEDIEDRSRCTERLSASHPYHAPRRNEH